MSNNKMAMIFTYQYSYAKYFYGCNQSPNTLSYYFKKLFYYFSSNDSINLYIRDYYNFAKFSYFCKKL